MRNRVQLIAYADRLAGDLPRLTALLTGRLDDVFGGVHVLPFFTPIDGADAGFDPTDHREVDPRLGTWDDVADLARHADVIVDLIVNHVSDASPQFADVRTRGDASPHAEMFLTYDRVFGHGATEQDLLRIYRPRPGLPFTPIRVGGGTRHLYWTTFTPHQLDLDVSAPATAAYLRGVLERFAGAGVTTVRLDAVGYAVKTPGTSCFLTDDTWAFVERLTGWVHDLGMQTLLEVHAYWRDQVAVAERADWTYDFGLPPLILHALFSGDTAPLRRWLALRPHNAVTVLDTHDGIGVIDVGPGNGDDEPGLLDAAQIDVLVEEIHRRSDGTSRQATGEAASNVDLYQVNCTYYDALGRDDDAYLLARLLQLFAPGVPQIYYVGLLAGTNDMDLLHRTGVGRDVNRHHYDAAEIDQDLQRPVVRRLLALIRLRNRHPAFDGTWTLLETADPVVAMRWEADDGAMAELHADLAARTFHLRWSDGDGTAEATGPDDLDRIA